MELIAEREDVLLQRGKTELKLDFVELRAKGWSYRRIASRLKVSKSTLVTWSQELEAEITSLKAMELEALYETYYLLKEGRIRLLGAILRKLKREISSRDFSEVATDKLLELLLKYQEALQAEYVEPRPLSVAALRTRAGTKLDSEAIAEELDDLLQRYQSGLVDTRTARDEVALLVAALKVEEQAVIEKKLERLESVLEDRR
ncbi:MAG: hypothetical protein BWX71_01053 [Deltaproteobacteria bacterium ADurb.Bin072]|nr:MAG: hypothetical protein BWX71_01053 [Deltaproteobacteria bacterium ADurb.Bin072]